MDASDDVRPSLKRLEGASETLHARRDLVGWTEIEDHDTILILADHLFKTCRQLDAPPGGEPALEHGKLHPITVTLDNREDAPPALPVDNVVRHDEKTFFGHGKSAGSVMGDTRDFTQKVTREQAALHCEDTPHADSVAEHRMDGFLIQAAFPRGDQGATARGFHGARGTVPDEIRLPDLAVVDDHDDRAVAEYGAERLHHVQGKCRTTGARTMEEAEQRIEPHFLEGDGERPHRQTSFSKDPK